jgi:hypothetical protein
VIFINYRRSDSNSYAALLYVELSRCFGRDMVFLDSESIPAGSDYPEQLLSRIRRARAVLAVIGPGWLTSTGTRWRPRAREQTDWTLRELAEAFTAGTPVIPILIDNTPMPTERKLPNGLEALSRCQYRRLRCRDIRADLDRILNDLVTTDPQLSHAARRRPAPARPGPITADGLQPARNRVDRIPARLLEPRHQAQQPAPPIDQAPEPLPSLHSPDTYTDQDAHATMYQALVASRKRCGSIRHPGD